MIKLLASKGFSKQLNGKSQIRFLEMKMNRRDFMRIAGAAIGAPSLILLPKGKREHSSGGERAMEYQSHYITYGKSWTHRFFCDFSALFPRSFAILEL